MDGVVRWIDYNNSLGYRPLSVEVVLKRNGIPIDTQILGSVNTSFSFEKLPQTDEAYELYHYTVEQYVPEKYILSKPDTPFDVYSTAIDKTESRSGGGSFSITNTLVQPKEPVVIFQPRRVHRVKVSAPEGTLVTLKQVEMFIRDGIPSFTGNLNGYYYNICADGEADATLISGRYLVSFINREHKIGNPSFSGSNITFDGTYLTIGTNGLDSLGTLVSLSSGEPWHGFHTFDLIHSFWKK